MRRSVPLRYRLPNATPRFVGRTAEIAALTEAIRRSPVTVVWGLGGSGKTALVLRTLHRRFPSAVERTLFVALRRESGPPDLEVARVLGQAVGERIDWPGLAADREAIAGAAIDLAESRPWWIVLEDVQYADPSHVEAFLGLFARYARRARLIATGRTDVRVPDSAVSLALGAMREADLARMAHDARRALEPAEARALARSAGGSPWRLLRRLEGRDDGDALGLSPALETWLTELSVLDVPVPRSTLESIAPAPEPVESLVRRGLLDAGGGGVRVHDAVRSLLPGRGEGESAALRSRLGAALVASGDPPALLEGVRLLLGVSAWDAAAQALGASGERLLAEGYGPRLWEMLEPHGAVAPLVSARLRCAVDVGTPEAIATVGLPVSPSLRDELDWARARRLAGDLPGAEQVAAHLREVAALAGEDGIAFEAGLLRARCVVQRAPGEALALLEALSAGDGGAAARRDALRAQALVYAGRIDEAVALARSLLASKARVPAAAFPEVGCGAARALYDASRLIESAEALDEVLAFLGPRALLRFHGRLALFLKTFIALDLGRFGEVRALLRRLDPLGHTSGFLQGSRRLLDLSLRLGDGDLEGIERLFEDGFEEARQSANLNYHGMVEALRVRVATIQGVRVEEMPASGEPPDPVIRATRDLHRIRNARRHGAAPRDAGPGAHELQASRELRVLAHIASSEAALLAGDARRAAGAARAAGEEAHAGGLGLEADACLAFLDAAIVRGAPDRELRAVLRRAESLASGMPSAGLGAEAAAVRAMLDGDPVALEAIARLPGGVTAARRARALLGEEARLDLVDARVIAAARARAGAFEIELVVGGAPDTAPWGVDERGKSVWVAGGRGRRISFAKRRLLLKLLSALCDRGGAATKEELVHDVWGEREYHPLKHDNRLHLAVLKTRRAVEDDPARPSRLLARSDGYALGGPVRRRKETGERGGD